MADDSRSVLIEVEVKELSSQLTELSNRFTRLETAVTTLSATTTATSAAREWGIRIAIAIAAILSGGSLGGAISGGGSQLTPATLAAAVQALTAPHPQGAVTVFPQTPTLPYTAEP